MLKPEVYEERSKKKKRWIVVVQHVLKLNVNITEDL